MHTHFWLGLVKQSKKLTVSEALMAFEGGGRGYKNVTWPVCISNQWVFISIHFMGLFCWFRAKSFRFIKKKKGLSLFFFFRLLIFIFWDIKAVDLTNLNNPKTAWRRDGLKTTRHDSVGNVRRLWHSLLNFVHTFSFLFFLICMSRKWFPFFFLPRYFIFFSVKTLYIYFDLIFFPLDFFSSVVTFRKVFWVSFFEFFRGDS